MQVKRPNRISVEEAAKIIGCYPETIRTGLRSGQFPVGVAIKNESGKYTFIIPRTAFMNWMEGGRTLSLTDKTG